MGRRSSEGTCLAASVRTALPVLREAERQCLRTRPGPEARICDWLIAVLIMIAVLKRKKSKSAQYRCLSKNRSEIAAAVDGTYPPSSSMCFDRHRREVAHLLRGEPAVM